MPEEEINEVRIPNILRRLFGLGPRDEVDLSKAETIAEVLHQFADRASGEAKKEFRFAARTVERAIRLS